MGKQVSSATRRTILLVLSCTALAIGNCGSPLIMRLYFLRGGKSIWLSSFLECGGWPIILFPLLISYLIRRKAGDGPETKLFFMRLPVFLATSLLGVFSGLNAIFFASGTAKLPVSTVNLITSTQLIFTALFAFLLVKQKFTPYSIAAIVLLTTGAASLALDAIGDRPEGETNRQYILGFLMTFLAAAITGSTWPLIEFVYKKATQEISYTVALEIQLIMEFFCTVFATIGMVINNDFKAIPGEAREFELGEGNYFILLVSSAMIWQFYLLGGIGVIFLSSSLLSGILGAFLLPISEVLAVFFFREKFQAGKVIALVLCLGGFVLHLYGEMKHSEKNSNLKNSEESTMLLREDVLV